MYSGGLLIAGVFDVVIPAKIFDCNKMLSGLYVGSIERQAFRRRVSGMPEAACLCCCDVDARQYMKVR